MKVTERSVLLVMMVFLMTMCCKDPIDPPKAKAIGWLATEQTGKKSVQAEGDTLKIYYEDQVVDSVTLGERTLVLNWDNLNRFTGFNAGDSIEVSFEYAGDTVYFKRTTPNREINYAIVHDSIYFSLDNNPKSIAFVFDPDYRWDKLYEFWGTDSVRLRNQYDYVYTDSDHPFSGLLTWVIVEQVFQAIDYPYFLITNKIIDHIDYTLYDYSTDPPTKYENTTGWEVTMDGDKVVQVYNGSTFFNIIYK